MMQPNELMWTTRHALVPMQSTSFKTQKTSTSFWIARRESAFFLNLRWHNNASLYTFIVKQLYDLLVEASADIVALVGAGDVFHRDLNAKRGRAHVNRSCRGERLHSIRLGDALPLDFGQLAIGGGFLFHQALNAVDDFIRADAERNQHGQFIPQPLAGSREIEKMIFNGIAIDERNFASGGMSGVIPIAGFHEHCAQQRDLDDLSANPLNLNPVADADSVLAHQNEPTDEADDEIFQCDRETSTGESDDRGKLAGQTKYH